RAIWTFPYREFIDILHGNGTSDTITFLTHSGHKYLIAIPISDCLTKRADPHALYPSRTHNACGHAVSEQRQALDMDSHGGIVCRRSCASTLPERRCFPVSDRPGRASRFHRWRSRSYSFSSDSPVYRCRRQGLVTQAARHAPV